MKDNLSNTFFPLGDCALTIDFGNVVDVEVNKQVIALFHHLKAQALEGVLDIVPAYSSLTVHYLPHVILKNASPGKTAFQILAKHLGKMMNGASERSDPPARSLRIPVCYAPPYGPDLHQIAQQKNISIADVIQLHTAKTYTVYMLGFLPGFAYMGSVDEKIAVPRKEEPRTEVPAGSVGIAGVQTGIYPLASPGGWQIIGRTPVKLFDKEAADPVALQPGDEVTFYSISEDEFENY